MKKLSKQQRALLELALEKTYAFLKKKLNIEISHDIYCIARFRNICFFQCSHKDKIAWDVCINLKKRKIIIVTRKAEIEEIYSKLNYELIYMGLKPITYTLDF